MIAPALVCLATCLGLSLTAPALGRLIHPSLATRLLAAVAISAATAVLWVAALGASTVVAQIPIVARVGGWSPALLAASDPVPWWAALVCALVGIRALVVAARTVARQLTGLVTLRRIVASTRPAGDLTVLDDPRGIAFATPVHGGRVVVSTGMLRALDPDERRALLAHESAHVRHGHYWWVAAAQLAAAVCPFLRAPADAVAQAAERWADESAAVVVGDRTVVARALARAALHTAAGPVPRGGVAAAQGRVVGRVEALLDPPPLRRLAPAWILVGLIAVTITMAGLDSEHTDALFDQSAAPTVPAAASPAAAGSRPAG